jgi:uncharacterized protein YabE (DUF348 family)
MVRFLFLVVFIVGGIWFWRGEFSYVGFWHTQQVWMPKDYTKVVRVILDDDGRVFEVMTSARTVQDFLNEQKLPINKEDILSGSQEDTIYEGKRIFIERAKHIMLTVGGEQHSLLTYQTDVNTMLLENNIIIGENDFILPKNTGVVTDGAALSVIRVDIKEQLIDKSIAFTKTTQEDATLSWRKSSVFQKGENGINRLTYKVVSYDGKEIDRKLIKQEVTKDPITEKTVQGTYVAVGKVAHMGLGTWYAYTGTLSAASPWLPMGSYAKVTNQENGKTVIVKINDRGPFGKNRILDLDKVAFAKIASIGSGIISLKVEEITN